jgi:cell division protein FtsW
MDFINKIFRGDRVIWMVFLFLCLISIVEVYSASSTLTLNRDYWQPILRHSVFLLLGLGVVLVIHAIRPRYFSLLGILLPVAWALLICVRVFGKQVNQSYRWFEIAGVTIQPSEIAKICLVCLVAFIVAKYKGKISGTHFRWLALTILGTCGLIYFENGSTALLLFGVIFLMLFVAQVPFRQLGQLVLYAVAALGLVMLVANFAPDEFSDKYLKRMKGTHLSRLVEFKDRKSVHDADFVINDDNLQVAHANIAIANGGIRPFGRMPGSGTERHSLPLAYADYIYAIIIEELGLIGGLFVMLMYIVFLTRAGIIANRCEKRFPKVLAMGAAILVTAQALSHMAVAVGLIPVTGQTLPLVSRGGASILTTCVYFGIILSVSRFDNPKGEEREEAILEAYNEDEETTENHH